MVIKWRARWCEIGSGDDRSRYVEVFGEQILADGECVSGSFAQLRRTAFNNPDPVALFVEVELDTPGQASILDAVRAHVAPAFLAEHPEFDQAVTMRGEVVL